MTQGPPQYFSGVILRGAYCVVHAYTLTSSTEFSCWLQIP